jgi:hypothetical protein
MVTVIAEGTRTARVRHRCFHCERGIAPGTRYGFQTNKYDYVYTIAWHLDCEALASQVRDDCDYLGDEGWEGLRDHWCSSGEYYAMLDEYRGHFPHVIARMELTDQLRCNAVATKAG